MKNNKIKIIGKKFYLKTLHTEDVNQRYVDWLNNGEVNKFLEVRHSKSTIESTKSFVRNFDNRVNYLFGIYDKFSDSHIGNSALYLDTNHNTANFGFLIGEKEYWGKKASLESCFMLFIFCFDHIKVRKVWGGVYSNNIGSLFNYKQLNFVEDGRLSNHCLFEGQPVDLIYYSMMIDDWNTAKSKISQKLNFSDTDLEIIL